MVHDVAHVPPLGRVSVRKASNKVDQPVVQSLVEGNVLHLDLLCDVLVLQRAERVVRVVSLVHDEEENAHGPPIDRSVVGRLGTYLRGLVRDGAFVSRDALVIVLDDRAQAKVADLEVLLPVHENVIGLEVAVNDQTVLQGLDTQCKLAHLWAKPAVLFGHEINQVAPFAKGKDQEAVGLVLV